MIPITVLSEASCFSNQIFVGILEECCLQTSDRRSWTLQIDTDDSLSFFKYHYLVLVNFFGWIVCSRHWNFSRNLTGIPTEFRTEKLTAWPFETHSMSKWLNEIVSTFNNSFCYEQMARVPFFMKLLLRFREWDVYLMLLTYHTPKNGQMLHVIAGFATYHISVTPKGLRK